MCPANYEYALRKLGDGAAESTSGAGMETMSRLVGGHAEALPEASRECAAIFESDRQGDLPDREVA